MSRQQAGAELVKFRGCKSNLRLRLGFETESMLAADDNDDAGS